jgi:hypothetical protein
MNNIDKFTEIKTYLISIEDIFKLSQNIIVDSDQLTVKELDNELQKKYKTNARTHTPYSKFLIEIFSNGLFNNSHLEYSKMKNIDNKRYYNILTIDKESRKEFEAIKTKRAKKKYLKEKLEQWSKEATKKYGYEIIFE